MAIACSGVEEENRIESNLVALVHVIGQPASGNGQFIPDVVQRDDLINPADCAAAGALMFTPKCFPSKDIRRW